ncbi:MAG TPA: FAD-dependent oxidoreductase, partial [Humisphaera sp.]|nr:FAD-dependent oxidoreductase [Humisphaera sp.]
MPDATIIGAGPAGSAAAILLARRGWSITLIEQHRFPRDKVCGECLSALGVDVIARLGLLPSLEPAGAVWLHHATIHGMDGRSATTPLPHPMLGVSRQKLDVLLLEAAIDAGASVLQPARCEAIESSADSASIRVRR